MTTATLTKIEAHQTAAEAAFRRLAATIAQGTEPKEQATDILRDAGRTVEDLKREVEVVRRRQELRRLREAEPALLKRQSELHREIVAANRELDKAAERYDRAVRPLAAEMETIADQLRQAGTARLDLLRSAPPQIRAELEQIRREVEADLRQRTAAQDRLAALRAKLREVDLRQQQREQDPPVTGAEQHERRQAHQHAERFVRKCKQQVTELEAEIGKLQARQDAAHQRTAELIGQAAEV